MRVETHHPLAARRLLALTTTLLLSGQALGADRVLRKPDLEASLGKRAEVCGVLKRVPMRKGHGKWQGTGLVLDDTTTVYVTYRKPPAGWERLVGERICVRALLENSSSESKQSLIAPHLSAWEPPVQVGPENAPLASSGLERVVGRELNLTGTARDSKAGAVLLTGNAEPVYIKGLAMWPEELLGKHISARGRLVHIKHIPDPHQAADGAISQGAVGLQYVLQRASWKAL